MSQWPSALLLLWPTFTECKYYHGSLSEFIVWTNHIVNGIFFICTYALSALLSNSFLATNMEKSFYCLKWETSILLARVMTLSGSTLSSYYICSSNPFILCPSFYSGALVSTVMSFFAWFALKLASLAGSEIELALALSYSIFNNNW